MYENFKITIDGPCGAGKTTTAKALAKKLGFTYLDTGLVYRLCAYHAIKTGFMADPDAKPSQEALDAFARDWGGSGFEIKSGGDGSMRAYVDGKDVTDELRTQAVSEMASRVSVHPAIRDWVSIRCRSFSVGHDVVIEGRDTGTALFPEANLKIYLTASPVIRAKRRIEQSPGEFESISQAVAAVNTRDTRDINRDADPLAIPTDSIYIDNSALTLKQTVKLIKLLAMSRNAVRTQDDPVGSFLLGHRYAALPVLANRTGTPDNPMYGNIYADLPTLRKHHPDAKIMAGFCLVDRISGTVPGGCADWHDTLDAVIEEYKSISGPGKD